MRPDTENFVNAEDAQRRELKTENCELKTIYGGHMRREIVLGLVIAVGGLSMVGAAVQAPPAGPSAAALNATKIEKVKDNLYSITGSSVADRDAFSGGNTAVFVTDTGVVIVDTKLPGWGQVILDRIKTVTNKPITTIINTHTHGDHTGSNEFFGTTVETIVQENTKSNMERMDAFKGEKAKFLPKRTYKDKLSIGKGKDQIDLYYFGPGHTNGDTFVVFTALRTMHMGDMFPWKDAPFLDLSNGGTGVELPKTLDRLIKGVSNVDTIIGGHLPVQQWKDLVEYQRFNADLLAATQAAMKAGKSVDEAVAGINLTSKYPGYESMRVKAAVQAIYDELNKK
jgi:glyoxylase-like metal-dependent hydrolase (beta-lactamase superfamily II)